MIAAEPIKDHVIIGKVSALHEHLGKGAGLAKMVIGPLVIFRSRQSTVHADHDHQDGQGQRLSPEMLLDN